ncbi:hypothetical protein Y032_0120g937 [Ancylostoma ceylanicum]|uniref:Uncharacterized protein n=1 Tax=Ancylostoma ceylanicum TaxID=53326 RepID=A0A016TAS3_9BILA|nr:hypothetical protein Y032_0120g937 [Ancylostoma ceylanicum]
MYTSKVLKIHSRFRKASINISLELQHEMARLLQPLDALLEFQKQLICCVYPQNWLKSWMLIYPSCQLCVSSLTDFI